MPGARINLADRPQAFEIDSALRRCSASLTDAALALGGYLGTRQGGPRPPDSIDSGARAAIERAVRHEREIATYDYPDYDEVCALVDLRLLAQMYAAGQLPDSMARRLPVTYARAFLYALDEFRRHLDALKRFKPIEEQVTSARIAFAALVPGPFRSRALARVCRWTCAAQRSMERAVGSRAGACIDGRRTAQRRSDDGLHRRGGYLQHHDGRWKPPAAYRSRPIRSPVPSLSFKRYSMVFRGMAHRALSRRSRRGVHLQKRRRHSMPVWMSSVCSRAPAAAASGALFRAAVLAALGDQHRQLERLLMVQPRIDRRAVGALPGPDR